MNNLSDILAKLSEISPLVWLIIAVLLVGSLFGVGVLIIKPKSSYKKASSRLHTKQLVYGGMCIAIAFVLSYIRLYKMPYGGSITLASMFPIILYAIIFGPIPGIIAGVAYGFLQLIQDAWVLNWAQLLFDYPLAYGCLGLAGMAPRFIKSIQVRLCLAIPIAILGRGLMHFISGVVFFADYAPEGMNPIYYSFIYNALYIVPEAIITLILALVLVSTPIYSAMRKAAIN
ncbi:energy-coupled thiamine transporter ThiT [Cellulosilyticum ruminicola]|uniref:energy-coupled thiamine transporter ThiT n=1 Tax=Cellulosilyticum ruminicola TaxID=425254 RepID=UPI0006D008FF|nr:energy-coupled thiamine transporter ThiT [Cellulosilyticum ruminicola]